MIELSADIEKELLKTANEFYEEKAEELGGIYSEIYYSMKEYGDAYNAIK